MENMNSDRAPNAMAFPGGIMISHLNESERPSHLDELLTFELKDCITCPDQIFVPCMLKRISRWFVVMIVMRI